MKNKNVIILLCVIIPLLVIAGGIILVVNILGSHDQELKESATLYVDSDSTMQAVFADDVVKVYKFDFDCTSAKCSSDSNQHMHDVKAVRMYAKAGIHNISEQYDSDAWTDEEFALLINDFVLKHCIKNGIVLNYFEIAEVK